MGQFQGDIDLQVIPNCECSWILCQDFSYTTDKGEAITVTKGLKTDLASTPRVIWNIYPPFGLYTGAAILHDCLYTRQDKERSVCDGIFLEAMATEGVSWITRHIIYRAVRMFGWSAWNQHAKENYERGNPVTRSDDSADSHNRDQG